MCRQPGNNMNRRAGPALPRTMVPSRFYVSDGWRYLLYGFYLTCVRMISAYVEYPYSITPDGTYRAGTCIAHTTVKGAFNDSVDDEEIFSLV